MMKHAPNTVRIVLAVATVATVFFGIAVVALNFGTPVGQPTSADVSSTTQASPDSSAAGSSEPTTSSPRTEATSPDTIELAEPSLRGIGAPNTTSSSSTPASTQAKPPPETKPTPTTQPKPTTTQPAPTTAAPPAQGAPDGAVIVNPGDDIQRLVNQNPAGTTFYLRAGVHQGPGRGSHVDPKSGNTFIGEPGAIMDGGGSTIYAFQDNMKGTNVTIRGLIIQNYANPAQRGAIDAVSDGWRIIGNEIRNNRGAGVNLIGNSWVIEGNNIHHNAQIGVKGQGSGGRVVSNTIANNNPNRAYDWAWEAGGTKFVKTTNLYVAGNRVLNNLGPGLWTDGDNRGTTYENNIVRDNAGPGIFHEISFSAVIRNNTVTGNAHPFYLGGILVANSSDVTVTGNTLSGNDGGIVGLQDSRGGYNTVNLNVTGNAVSHSSGVTGLVYNSGTDVAATGSIRFDNNSYQVGGDRPFAWKGGSRTIAEWQGLGQDLNSSFN
ncbi:MAG TPA: right-handed parallel beta-helix repeat-containing protein [Acidimicrobiia bacterium]|nr:right-handed parallel beta-helix repeat-containing protein [Acidimicrobiia bacterium]